MIDLVIRNILSNSIKFTKEKGKIIIDMYYEESMVIIKISDTGIGISKENINKIMSDNFYTTRGTSNEKGSGLGLSLCKYFIEMNHGKLSIESEVGKGSTFSFTLNTN